ncbi:MAG: hypothetical protein ABIP51_14285 [Bacteroidia bacterium]
MENKETWYSKNEKNIGRISIIVIFLGLVRCISEFYRLEYTLQDKLSIAIIKPFITGALIAAIGAFLMVILYFFSKCKFVLIIGIIIIICMLLVKKIYMLD